MKILVISRGHLEVGRAQLNKPLFVVGRSPTSDLVLRAPGVKPVHFLVEWAGGGSFDPNVGSWTALKLGEVAEGAGDGEGIVLNESSSSLDGFFFHVVEDKFESAEKIGGQIQASVAKVSSGSDMLEMVQIRADSGAVENVLHLRRITKKKVTRPLKAIPQFQVQWGGDKQTSQALLHVLLQEMPGAQLFRQGQLLAPSADLSLSPMEFLQVRWKGFDFFLRLVKELKPPPVDTDPLRDPLLKKTLLGVTLFTLAAGGIFWFLPQTKIEEVAPKPRIATIEVKEVVAPPPEMKRVEPKDVADKVAIKKKTPELAGIKNLAVNKKPGKAAAPRYNSNEGKQRLGLNSPAEAADVNTIGVLGALKKSGTKGGGVRADQIFNEGIVTEAVSGANDASGITVKNPLAGSLGQGGGGVVGGQGKGIGGASTTLQGAGKYDPNSVGPLARKGGGQGYNLGTGLSDGGSGVGGGSEMGTIDAGEFSVEGGGLDRETVRRVIAANRGKIRTCYERALLASPKLLGRVSYKWAIAPTGPVVQAEIKQSTLDSSNLKACVLQVIREMVFPVAVNGLPTRVIYPFVFQSKN